MIFSNFIYNRNYLIIITLFAIFLNGCQNSPPISFDRVTESSDYYFAQAEHAIDSRQTDYKLLAIHALIREKKIAKAEHTLNHLPKQLSPAQLKEGFLLAAEIEIIKQQPARAQLALNKLIPEQLNRAQQYRFYQLQIKVASPNDKRTKLRNYVQLLNVAPTEKKQAITDASWALLNTMTPDELNRIVINANEITLLGWIKLISTYVEHHENNARLVNAINIWQVNYPSNPYNQRWPTPLKRLLENSSPINNSPAPTATLINPTAIALLLPLDSNMIKRSQAIEEGFKAGMRKSGMNTHNLNVYNTSELPINFLLQQIKQQNDKTIVVGPLLKNEVDQLAFEPTTLPILALNKPSISSPIANICYFALDPEDEARSAADYMTKQHVISPLIIAPNNELGHRLARAFETEWLLQHTHGVLVQYINNDDYLRNLALSNGLTLKGYPITNESPAALSEPDALYIIAEPQKLNLIKSMIDLAADKPFSNNRIYAMSYSHNAQNSIDFRLDMEGLHFSDIPLLADVNNIDYRVAPNDFKNDYSLMRLYALGLDAWKLISQLPIWHSPVLEPTGSSGELSVDANCIVQRKLTWLTYEQGHTVIRQ